MLILQEIVWETLLVILIDKGILMTESKMTPMDDNYPTCERTYAELRIYSQTLNPQKITNIIGITPTTTQVKGEFRRSRIRMSSELNIIRGRIISLNGWFLSSEKNVKSKDLRRHLDFLLYELDNAKVKLKALQEKDDIEISVNCVWWSVNNSGGPTLWPDQMGKLAKLDLELSIDFSFYGDEPIL